MKLDYLPAPKESARVLKQVMLVIGELAWLAGILAGSLGVGRWLLARCQLTSRTPSAETALGLGLGLSLLSYLIFALAAVHVLSTPSLVGLTAFWVAGAALLWFPPALKPAFSETSVWGSPWAKALLLLLGIQIFFNGVGALTPAWDWDGVAYHLALPKIYLSAGGFVFRPDIYHNLFPQLTEMLYLLGLLFPWGSAAKLIHLAFGLLAALAVYALGREQNWKFSALLAATVFYSQYLVHLESGTAFIDLAGTAYLCLAALAYWQTCQPEAKPGWFYLAAFFAGLVAATKWHGLILLALAVGLLWANLRTLKPASRIKAAAWVILFGLAPVLPYLARAAVQSGNPIWPLGYSIFHGAYWDAGMDKSMGALVAGFAGHTHGWLGFLRLPYDLVAHGDAFGIGGNQLRWPLIGLVLLALANLAFFRPAGKETPASPSRPWLWLGAGLVYLVVWFASSPQMRFLLPLWGLAALGAAWGLRRLWLMPGHAPKLAAAAAGLLLFSVHPPVHGDTLLQFKTVAGRVSAEDFLTQKLDHYPACRYLNEHVRPGERILLFQENRGFYLDGDYLWGDPKNQIVIDYRRLHSPDELAARLKSLRVCWVLYRKNKIYAGDYYSPKTIEQLDACLLRYGVMACDTPSTAVYRLDFTSNR
jgi:hypothetical protein